MQRQVDRIGTLLPTGTDEPAFHFGARRASQRFNLHADVEVYEPHHAKGIALNASVGGIRIALDQPLRVGDMCVLSVRPSPERAFSERARVVWSQELLDGWVIGLEFLGLN